MGSIVVEKNERHAAWERSWPAPGATKCSRNHPRAAWEALFLKKTNATLHGSAPAAQGRPRLPKRKNAMCFIKNVDFHWKCAFGSHKGVLHYVLKRKRVMLRKHAHFELEICVKARGGQAAPCMGSVPVADLLASEARRPRTSGRGRCAYGDPSLCLFPGDRSRESCGTWQLPQTMS